MLHLHRSERADGLIAGLSELLASAPADPFATEVISVPTRGIERWLSQRLSAALGAASGRQDGICAGIEFPAPHPLLTGAIAAASGIDPDADPWAAERLVWPLLEVVERDLQEPWLLTLRTHLLRTTDPDEPPRARRLGTVRHLAELYDRYALHRPAMLSAWATGRDVGGDQQPLPPATAWQAELWRRVRARLQVSSPSERLERACAKLAGEPDCVELPGRIALFGLTRLPAGHLRVLDALSRGGRDVHLFLLHPSPELWDRVAAIAVHLPPVLLRREDPTVAAARNPLLASWGRDAREMQLVLAHAHGEVRERHRRPHEPPAGSRSLLARIQADVRADRPPPGEPAPGRPDQRAPLAPEDRSIEVHGCYGRARQVEVLRDALLHILSEDPDLEPRDIIVMCPDIETFAPLIRATFGAGAGEADQPAGAVPELRVRLADRALRQTNPLIDAVAELLELTATRLTASQVLGFADREPVRRRFRLDDDDLDRLQGWIAGSGIRWGLDAPHRAPFSLETIPSGTWRSGLDRVLLGVTMTEESQRLFAGVLPLDDVDNGAIELAGRFAELIARLGEAVDAFAEAKPMSAWAASIARAADSLTAAPRAQPWQRTELQRLLDALAGEAAGTGAASALSVTPAELRAMLAERLQGRPTRASFRTGSLTVCTLVPMRSVPHRVVCLLGLDDDVFPGRSARDGDDLTLADPHVGERDARSEDRQMLLDALLAASDKLLITYSAGDERTGARLPPAVPLGELLDTVDATVRIDRPPGDRPVRARERIVVPHPLQPFDRRNFIAGRLGRASSWSFDPVMREGAESLAAPHRAARPFLAAPLPARRREVVELDELVRFVQHPVRAFLRLRLGISVADQADEIEDGLRVQLSALQRWDVGQRILDARLRGVPQRQALIAEIRRGMLPPESLGEPVLVDEVAPIVERIVVETERRLGGVAARESRDVRVELPDGRSLRGTVPGVSGTVLHASTFSRVSARHRLSSWVHLLALTGSAPELAFSALTVGRAPQGRDAVTAVEVSPLGEDAAARRATAVQLLGSLVDLLDRGLREPLPLPCKTAAAYASAATAGGDAIAAAREEWESGWQREREDRDPEHELVLGGRRSLTELLALEPGDGEQGAGWEMGEQSRLGRLALRLWGPLLARERTVTG